MDIECGSAPDGCGNTLDCGSCPLGQACNAGKCPCSQATCAALGYTCGSFPDGCGGTLACGTCPAGQGCEGGACVCAPQTCAELGYACGSIAEFVVSFFFFIRDFQVPHARLLSLTSQSFSASVIGSFVSYLILDVTGNVININTTIGIFSQGLLAGSAGVLVAIGVLYLLKNQELKEAFNAFARHFKDLPLVAIEPTDVAS